MSALERYPGTSNDIANGPVVRQCTTLTATALMVTPTALEPCVDCKDFPRVTMTNKTAVLQIEISVKGSSYV